ncbi:hypothetical protein DSL64_16030 [Dyadobacter luteus]|uniref:Uncharacterized protein n=1 Tax=Dyadobacter luteus TaxID=2259619 RepID=A0A3D8YAQ1_9BACT|nr:hypothetical protein [Dyadobacter luteus]REA60180.1 hypothetical protein DSL64_16030 [Dyadobacter luteus]
MIKDEEYILQWLDTTVRFSLNPKGDLTSLSERDLQLITQRARSEVDRQMGFLQEGTLKLFSEKKIKVFINQYHRSLVSLLDSSYLNLSLIGTEDTNRANCCEVVILCLEKLVELVSIRFSGHLLSHQPVARNQSTQIQKDFLQKSRELAERFKSELDCASLTTLILAVIQEFTQQIPSSISYSQILYFQGMISHLERIELKVEQQPLHDRLIELLVGLNFNDRRFIGYYTHYAASHVNQTGNGKMQRLLLLRKRFYQAYLSSDQALNAQLPSLRKIIGNWFKLETAYISKVRTENVSPLDSNVPAISKNPEQPTPKIMCLLSADQIGMILHSLDALRIVQAKSMSAVFENIIPSLSTPQKKDLSWKSMRSKSYVFEENDRKAVTAILHSMIKFIDEY